MALLHMDATCSGEVVSTKDVAEACGTPAELLGKVMQAMARAGLIAAEHGSRGGYRLDKDLATVSLGQVIEAIEGPTPLVRCQQDADGCMQHSSCIVKEPLHDIHVRLQDFIHGITLDQLRRREQLQAAGR